MTELYMASLEKEAYRMPPLDRYGVHCPAILLTGPAFIVKESGKDRRYVPASDFVLQSHDLRRCTQCEIDQYLIQVR